MMDGQFVTVVILAVIAFLFITKGVHLVPDGKARILERLGKRHKVLMPGFNIAIPLLDRTKKDILNLDTIHDGTNRIKLSNKKGDISLAEQRLDPPEILLLASDNSEVTVDAVAYFRITDPMKVVYEVASFPDTFMSMINTTLRQVVGTLDGDSLISSRESLSESLRFSLQEAGSNWGILILRVEIEKIEFSNEIRSKLSEAREEELLRRAEIVATQSEVDKKVLLADAYRKTELMRAEADREVAILKAEGEKQSTILEAEGNFEKKRLEAEGVFLANSREKEGVAKGFAAISDALKNNPETIVALEALKAQEGIAESIGQSQNTLIVPTETAGLLGAFASLAKGWKTLSDANNKEVISNEEKINNKEDMDNN